MNIILILFFANILPINTLFFGGGGCGGCSQPQPRCSCPPPPPRCGCSPSPCRSYQNSYHVPQYYTGPQLVEPPQYAAPHQSYVAPQQNYVAPIAIRQPAYSVYPEASYFSSPRRTLFQVQPSKDFSSSSDVLSSNASKSSKTGEQLANELDQEAISLATFESSLANYKMQGTNNIRRKALAAKREDINGENDGKCSSPKLRILMKMVMMSTDVTNSKLRIAQKAKKEFGFNFDVICSEHDFSYLISSSIFCRMEYADLICLAYEK